MENRLKAGKPSLTAEIQAGLRFASTSECLQIRGNDRLAKHFLTGINNLFRIPLARKLAIAKVEKLWPGGYGYSLARSRATVDGMGRLDLWNLNTDTEESAGDTVFENAIQQKHVK